MLQLWAAWTRLKKMLKAPTREGDMLRMWKEGPPHQGLPDHHKKRAMKGKQLEQCIRQVVETKEEPQYDGTLTDLGEEEGKEGFLFRDM